MPFLIGSGYGHCLFSSPAIAGPLRQLHDVPPLTAVETRSRRGGAKSVTHFEKKTIMFAQGFGIYPEADHEQKMKPGE
jgi:hypothetical protein